MADDRVGDKLFEVETGPVPAPAVTPVGAHKRFRHYDQSQSFLLPPSLDDWLPENHEARFISEVVDTMLDLDCIYDSYTEASGAPPYDPAMMLKLLLFAYSIGVTSSREMERRCHTDVAFRWLSANAAPDYRSLSRFRRRHLCGHRRPVRPGAGPVRRGRDWSNSAAWPSTAPSCGPRRVDTRP